MIIGYHASYEQFSPSALLSFVRGAEEVGFQAIMTSDHINPWSERQGNSGNNWAWLGAALATTSLPFGTLAIPGGWRYHPVTLAHLIATLAEMYPDRLRWIAVGSGEAMNETVVTENWPEKAGRNARLRAASEIIRSLLRGETVSAHHPWFQVNDARMWSLPSGVPKLFGAALTSETAGWMASWVDGLVTVRKSKPEIDSLMESFRASGGAGKPSAVQLQIAWAATRDDARMAAWEQWRCAAAPPHCLADLRRPADFDHITKDVRPSDMDDVVPLVVRGDELLALIEMCASCGAEEIYIHNVSRNQQGFLQFMQREVLPFT